MTRISRRSTLRFLAAGCGAAMACRAFPLDLKDTSTADATPPLARGAPMSPERLAVIDAFRKESEGLQDKYEARNFKADFTMPYRLFRPASGSGKLPLVVYLSGSGGLGDDNLKQLEFGNIFGTRVWLLAQNQKRFPCFVVAPQTDRGWARYDLEHVSEGRPPVLPGEGDGNRLAFAIVQQLLHEFPIDENRVYVTGQSMGGAGSWNMIASHPGFFAAAVVCCGSATSETGIESLATPMWVFQGDADGTVPVSVSRDRVAARRKVGGRPIYTEYAGVDHNVWEWAYTEPELLKWVFSQRRV